MEITIQANESGRLWTADPAAWQLLCSPGGYPMCGEEPHPEWILAETDICKISAWREGVLPGYACVVSKQHVVEPFDLSERDQTNFFLDAMAAARGLAGLLPGQDELRDPRQYRSAPPHAPLSACPRRCPCRIPEPLPGCVRSTDEEIDRMRQSVRAELGGRLLT